MTYFRKAQNFLLILVFFFLPCFGIFLSWEEDFLAESRQIEDRQMEDFRRTAWHGAFVHRHAPMVARLGNAFYSGIRKGDPFAYVASLPWDLPSFANLEIAIFPRGGKLVSPPGSPVSSRKVFTVLAKDLEDGHLQEKNVPWAQSAVGPYLARDLEWFPGVTISRPDPKGEKWFFWKIDPDGKGVMILSRGVTRPLEPWRKWLRRRKGKSRDYWLLDRRNGKWIGTTALDEESRAIIRRAPRTGWGKERSSSDSLYFTGVLGNDLMMVLRTVDPDVAARKKAARAWVLLGMLLPACWMVSLRVHLLELPLFSRLVAIFLSLTLLPLYHLGRLGTRWSEDRQRELLDRRQESNLETLRKTDSRISEIVSDEINLAKGLWKRIVTEKPDPVRRKEMLEKARAGELFLVYRVISGEGGILDQTSVRNDQGELQLFFGQEMLRRYGILHTPGHWAMTAILRSPLFGFSGLSDRRGEEVPWQMDNSWAATSFWDVDPHATATEPAFFFWFFSIGRILPELLRRSPQGMWIQSPNYWTRWEPNIPQVPCPDDLFAQSCMGGEPASRVVRHRGRPYLVTLLPTSHLLFRTTVLMTIADLGPEAEMLRTQSRLLWSGVVTSLLIVGILALVISRSFLVPVRRISNGIRTMEEGRLDAAIPDLGPDEFGELGRAFNDMMAELAEHDRARTVQDSLIPAVPRTLPGFEVALRYQPLHGLCGDYTDTLCLPDGKLLLVLGDVTGHGVSAALMATMAKAICSLSVLEGLDLARLSQRLNHVIAMVGKRRQMMTMFAACLDAAAGDLEWTGAGAPFPLMRQGDGSVKFLEQVGFPLGSSAAKRNKPEKLAFPDGAALLIYSDGLYEALDESQNPFGFPRLEALLKARGFLPAEGLASELMNCLRKHQGRTPPADDTTILILRRVSNPVSPHPAVDSTVLPEK